MPTKAKPRRNPPAATSVVVEQKRPDLDLLLDPENPRLGDGEKDLSQPEILEIMVRRFRLEDIAESIIAAGFQAFDPIIGYRSGDKIVIREGNRRTAALKLLLHPEEAPSNAQAQWLERSKRLPAKHRPGIAAIGVTVFPSKEDEAVDAYVGFRHVTGVLEWPAKEKARFVAELIQKHGWSYGQIAERLGSYARHVEKLYVAYQLISQAKEDEVDGADNLTIGTLLRALQTQGVREFLAIAYPGDPALSERPIPEDKSDNFKDFVRWAFGTEEDEPVLSDSRQLTRFGAVLKSSEAVRYLRSADRPSLDRAWVKSGGQRESLVNALLAASDRLEESAALTPDYAGQNDEAAKEVLDAIDRCARFMSLILRDYEPIRTKHFEKRSNARSS